MSAIETMWTNEKTYLAWFVSKLTEPNSASMRTIGGSCLPETIVLSGRYREVVSRTSIALCLVRRDLDIQRSLNVIQEAVRQANELRRIVPGSGRLSFGPLGRIKWILDDGVPTIVPTYAAVAQGRTLVFSGPELPYDEEFWSEYWLHRAMQSQGQR
jgi:hypothetical protein